MPKRSIFNRNSYSGDDYLYSYSQHSHGGIMSNEKPNMRAFRKRERAGGMMRGGRIGCIIRWIFCVLILGIIIVVSILATIILYIKPPNLSFLGVQPPLNGSTISTENNALNINFDLQIQVDNPNTFGAKFNDLYAQLYYGGTNTNIGYGRVTDVEIHSERTTEFRFPFHIVYKGNKDPNMTVLRGLLSSCGLVGTGTSNIDIDYDLNINIKALSVDVKESISNSMSIQCPDFGIETLQNAVGQSINIQDLINSIFNEGTANT